MSQEFNAKLKIKGAVLVMGESSGNAGDGASISSLASFAALQGAELSSDTLYALPSEVIPLTSNESALDAQQPSS